MKENKIKRFNENSELNISDVINSFFSKLFCFHKYGETICGGIHYSYKECEKCGKTKNTGSSWD
jgi:hypothetical protein